MVLLLVCWVPAHLVGDIDALLLLPPSLILCVGSPHLLFEEEQLSLRDLQIQVLSVSILLSTRSTDLLPYTSRAIIYKLAQAAS